MVDHKKSIKIHTICFPGQGKRIAKGVSITGWIHFYIQQNASAFKCACIKDALKWLSLLRV
jgi:hypothetical protein